MLTYAPGNTICRCPAQQSAGGIEETGTGVPPAGRTEVGRMKTVAIMVSAAFLGLTASLQVSAADADVKRDVIERLSTASQYMKSDCEKAWHTLWPMAKSADKEIHLVATTALLAGYFNAGLLPPGRADDAITHFRYFVTLLVHSAKSDARFVRDLIESHLSHRPWSLIGGGDFRACLKREPNKAESCIEEAVGGKFVPSFADFVAELDTLIRTATLPARCERRSGIGIWLLP